MQHRADSALGQRHRVGAAARVPLDTARLLSPTQCRGGSRAGSAGRRGPPDTVRGPLEIARPTGVNRVTIRDNVQSLYPSRSLLGG